jgi:succinoglycan biosynthesis transport protein ExoP
VPVLQRGLVDKTDQVITKAKDEQEQQIARKFESLIQVLRLKRTLDQVSYRLILNDLKGLKDSTWREPVKCAGKYEQSR